MLPSTEANKGEVSPAESLRARMGELRSLGATGLAPQNSLAEIVKERKAAEAREAVMPATGRAEGLASENAESRPGPTSEPWAAPRTPSSGASQMRAQQLEDVTLVASQMRAQELEAAPADDDSLDLRKSNTVLQLPATVLTLDDEDGRLGWTLLGAAFAAILVGALAWFFMSPSATDNVLTAQPQLDPTVPTEPFADEDLGDAAVTAGPVLTDGALVDEVLAGQVVADEVPDRAPLVDDATAEAAAAAQNSGAMYPQITLPGGPPPPPAEPALTLPAGLTARALAPTSASYLDGRVLVLEGAGSTQAEVDAFVSALQDELGERYVRSNLTVEDGSSLPDLGVLRIDGTTSSVAAFSDYLVSTTSVLTAFPDSQLSVVAQPSLSGSGSSIVAETQRAAAIVTFFERTGFSPDRLTATTLPASDQDRPPGGFSFLISNLAPPA